MEAIPKLLLIQLNLKEVFVRMYTTTEQEFGQNIEDNMRSAADELERITEKVIKGVGMNAVESKYCQRKCRLCYNLSYVSHGCWIRLLCCLLPADLWN